MKGQTNMVSVNDIKERLKELYSQKDKTQVQLSECIESELTEINEHEDEMYQDENEPSELIILYNVLDSLDEEIRSLERDVYEKERNDYFMNNRNRFKKGTSISDLKTSRDTIDRKFYAKMLSEYISDDQSEKVNLGVFGKWGQGKSSFLELIKDELIRKKGSKVISYDASICNEKEEIWTQLIKILFDHFEKESKCNKFKYFKRKLIDDICDNRWKYGINCLLIVFLLLIVINKGEKISILSNNKIDIKKINFEVVYTYIIGMYTLIISIIPACKIIKNYLSKLSSFLIKRDLNQTFNEINSIKNKLIKEYEIIEKIWLNENERIYIIVDELDRLNALQIVNFFDALQMFIDLKKISFIFSIDYKTVCCALADNQLYQIEGTSLKSKIKFGMKYLEKYVNIPFHLNIDFVMSSFTDSFSTQIRKNEKSTENKKSEDLKMVSFDVEERSDVDTSQCDQFIFTDSEINTINNILDSFRPNPREAKLIMGILFIAKNIHYEININKINKNHKLTIFEDFIRWFCFSYYYPNEKEHLQSLLVKQKRLNPDELIFNIKDLQDEIKGNVLMQNAYSIVNMLKIRDLTEFSNISKLFIFSFENIE